MRKLTVEEVDYEDGEIVLHESGRRATIILHENPQFHPKNNLYFRINFRDGYLPPPPSVRIRFLDEDRTWLVLTSKLKRIR